MSSKNFMQNSGVPLYVNSDNDLKAQDAENTFIDSWYLNCAFEQNNKKMGFEWHHQVVSTPMGRFHSIEFLLMDSDKNKTYDHAYSVFEDATHYVSGDALEVSSKFGMVKGDKQEISIRLSAEHGELNVIMKPKDELYNGTTGLLNIFSDSYQFSFPNALISGEFVMNGDAYKLNNVTSWFDRQFGKGKNYSAELAPKTIADFKLSWLWIGMTIGEDDDVAISLWDAYTGNGRNCFGTILYKDSTQKNVLLEVEYGDIWRSDVSKSSYSKRFSIRAPSENLVMNFTSLIDDAEFTHDSDGIHGCQCLCECQGEYNGKAFSRTVIVEMIGNLCGE